MMQNFPEIGTYYLKIMKYFLNIMPLYGVIIMR